AGRAHAPGVDDVGAVLAGRDIGVHAGPDHGQALQIIGADRFLVPGDAAAGRLAQHPDRLLAAVAAVGVDVQLGVGPDDLAGAAPPPASWSRTTAAQAAGPYVHPVPVRPPACAHTTTSVVESQASVPSPSGPSVGIVYAAASSDSTSGLVVPRASAVMSPLPSG